MNRHKYIDNETTPLFTSYRCCAVPACVVSDQYWWRKGSSRALSVHFAFRFRADPSFVPPHSFSPPFPAHSKTACATHSLTSTRSQTCQAALLPTSVSLRPFFPTSTLPSLPTSRCCCFVLSQTVRAGGSMDPQPNLTQAAKPRCKEDQPTRV